MKKDNKQKYKFLEHTADVKFQAYGKTLNEVFKNAALAVAETMARESKIKAVKKKKIRVQGKRDLESLLFNFIEEILYLVEAENFVIAKVVSVKVNEKNLTLSAEFSGDNADKYPLDHIKAATYSEIYVKKIDKGMGWEAQTVVDV